MYRSKEYAPKPSRMAFWLMVLSLSFVLVVSVSGMVHAQGGGTVTGTVFRDYNANGTQDTVEPGMGGITITAYGAGNTMLASTTSSQTPSTMGQYSLSWASTDARVRLEFSGLPAFLKSGAFGAQSGTSVQFVNDGDVADFGVNNPHQFCGDNPKLSTSCYVFGDQVSGANSNLPAIISFDYNSTGGVPQNETTLATASQVAATYGMAPQSKTDSLYVGAFVKRHVGLISTNNPGGNPGMIYKISGGSVTSYITLSAGSDPHTPTNTTVGEPDYFDDAGAFDAVGKVGLADIDISEDENELYVVNLTTKQLDIVDATGATGSLIRTVSFPQPASCAAADTIPGALAVFDGIVYVGLTCTGPTIGDLRAYVYPYNGSTFGAPVVDISLNYPRSYATTDGDGSCPTFPAASVYSPGHCVPATWQPWTNTPTSFFTGPFGNQRAYPQPWLLDIEIDEYGFMILNFADRMGHQSGNSTGTGSGPVEGVSAGDLLRLAPSTYPVSNATWTLENNGSVGTAGDPGSGTSTGQNTGEGPGNGEFYPGDAFGTIHHEIFLGGTALIYGRGEVASAAFDPTADIRSGGVIMNSNSTGAKTNGIEVFEQDQPGTFGKAAGIGDIELQCSGAPIEIGNYVWYDANQNGVQDPNELPMEGIEVQLYDVTNDTVIATAVTDANGQYIFSSDANGTSNTSFLYNLALSPNSPYRVQIDMGQTALAGYSVTTANAGGAPGDIHDSDGVLNTTTNLDSVSLTTGAAGDNNHTFDFGFFAPPYSLGNRVWFDNGSGGGTPNDGIQNGTEPGIDGVTVNLLDSNGNVVATTVTTGGGYYLFDNLPPGTYTVQIPATNFAPGAILNGLDSSGGGSATPDDNTDLDDNGIGTTPDPTNGIVSGPITLGPPGPTDEPTNETDIGPQGNGSATNNHSNLTVDFGFYSATNTNYSLGNRVWLDSNNSGTIDAGELGIGGVVLNLYTVTGGVVSTTPLRTTTTTSAGYYLFDNLPAGDYVVEVAPANCNAGGPLAGLSNSTGAGQEADPNQDGDSNDNGLDSSGTCSVRSGIVTLGPGPSEPPGETDLGPQGSGIATDDHSNLTVDFGYFGTPTNPQTPVAPITLDPAITKQVNPAFAQPGDEVRWTITLHNPHAVAINNVGFVDNFASQLEVLSATVDTMGGTLVVSGNTVTYNIVVMSPGQTINVRVLTRVRVGTPVPFIISNTVNLSGAYVGSASATLLSAGALPATGLEPAWRTPLLVGMVVVLLALFGAGAVRTAQRRKNLP